MALKIQPKTVLEVLPEVEAVVIPETVLVQTPVSEVEALTAEYIELWKKFDYFEVKALVKRMDEVRKTLQSIANETMDEKKPAVFSCPTGEIEFSERGKTSTIPDPLALVQELLSKFGPEVTATVVDIAITPLRKLLSDFELKKHMIEEPGGRTLKSVRPVK